MPQTAPPLHRAILTIGSNTDAERHVPYVLAELRRYFTIKKQTSQMLTSPIDFPYPSADFVNVVLIVETNATKSEVYERLKAIEVVCGRSQESRRTHPALVPMDLDLIIWDEEICKPRDLTRGYVIEGLKQLNISIPSS